MSNQDNSDALLDALRRVGVVIPSLPPIAVRSKPTPTIDNRVYWHVVCGPFDTYVDPRDAQNQDDALAVACGPLQNWYVHGYIDKFSVTPSNHAAYLEWLHRGVR